MILDPVNALPTTTRLPPYRPAPVPPCPRTALPPYRPAVVSNDVRFVQHILGSTVNGTTYAGIRARTTGAPQNHWFGPAGDPRAAGIGTPEAIRLVWSTHRWVGVGWVVGRLVGWSVDGWLKRLWRRRLVPEETRHVTDLWGRAGR